VRKNSSPTNDNETVVVPFKKAPPVRAGPVLGYAVKDIDNFDFTGTPVNEALVRDLATGAFVAEQRNAVLIGGTGTGQSHLAIAIARACIRGGARGRFLHRRRPRQPAGE
jgi:DNA replication protein DnaC